MAKNLLLDKTFACLAGGAIGDAMGGITEGWHYEAIREKYGVLLGLHTDLGVHQRNINEGPYTYTDDTYFRIYMVDTIIKKGGRITAYDLADVWLDHFDIHWAGPGGGNIFRKLLRGLPPRETGEGEIRGMMSCLGIEPIGIVNACDPKSAASDAFDVACMNEGGYGREVAIALAAAVAEAFKPEATVDSVIEAAKAYAGTKTKEHIEKAISIARKYDDGVKAIPEFYDKLLVPMGAEIRMRHLQSSSDLIKRFGTDNISNSDDPLEQVPVALAFFYTGKGDPMKTMIAAANFGRDADTITSFAGCIAGAFSGSEKIDKDMVEKVNKANNTDLMKQAERMQGAIINVMKEKERSLESLKKLM